MNAKDQKKFHKEVREQIKARGIRISAFLAKVPISATHWHFVGKGERPLTNDLKTKIKAAAEAAY